jgi:hypothetical protein
MPYATLPLCLMLTAQVGSSTATPAVTAAPQAEPAPALLDAPQTPTAPAPAEAAAEKPAEAGSNTAGGMKATNFFDNSDFIDTRVTFALSNVNVLAGPGERATPTSGYRIGIDPGFNLFLENVNTRFSGYETLSQLVLYKKIPGFWDRWETEAALAARVSANTDTGQLSFFDAGTYLRVIRKLGDGKEEDTGSIDLTAFPVSSDRFRLGYTYLISWGGTTIFPGKLAGRISEGAVPGARLRWRAPKGTAYAFVGFKTALILSRDAGVRAGEQVPNYGLLAGAGGTLFDSLILEANGGIFQKGTQERPGLEGNRISAFGASGRITYFQGTPPASSADYKLVRNDPNAPENYDLFKPYKPGVGWYASLEGTVLTQNLEDADAFASEKLVPAVAAGLVGSYKHDELTVRFDGFYQSADFILFDVPGFVPFQATPGVASTTGELFAAVSASYWLEGLNMNPVVSVGVKVPATYQGKVLEGQGGNVGGAQPGDVRTQIIVDNRTRVVLPPDTDATPIIGMMLKLPLYLSSSTAVSFESRVEINDNQPRLGQDNERGEITYLFDEPLRLSLALVLQSRW